MERNMIEANKKMFAKAIDYTLGTKGDASLDVNRGVTRFLRTDSLGKKWLKNCKIEVFLSHSMCHAALLSLEAESYLCIWNVEKNYFDGFKNDFFSFVDVNSGLFTLLASELSTFAPKASPSEVYQYMLYDTEQIPNYKGHDFDHEIISLYPKITLLKLNSSICENFDANLNRVLVLLFCEKADALILPISQKTLELFKKISISMVPSISYQSLFWSLTAGNWRHLFLELYRILEFYFPYGFFRELVLKANVNSSVSASSIELKEIGKQRFKEAECMQSIFSLAETPTLNKFNEVKTRYELENNEGLPNWFYGIRNRIVHNRQNEKEINLNVQDYNDLSQAVLMLIENTNSKIGLTDPTHR